jgi:hypothetical protein
VTVACGGDNVRDAFIGWGDFDLVEVYVESVRLAHLDTRLVLLRPSVVTTGPAKPSWACPATACSRHPAPPPT